MSQLHAELTEQAYELGFENLEEALANGYEVDYEECRLLHPYVLTNKEHEKAHKAWLEERGKVVDGLKSILNAIDKQPYSNMTNYELFICIKNIKSVIANAIDFIEKGEV